MNENFILHIKGDSCNIVVFTNPPLINEVKLCQIGHTTELESGVTILKK